MMVVSAVMNEDFVKLLENDWGKTFVNGLESEPFHYFLRDHMCSLLTKDDGLGRRFSIEACHLIESDVMPH